ncbi:MAG: ATP-dependent helicase [Candidatus Eremiobacteraeota bacterium]|nr:ATP-dependent helicase [Candidatus Eremiobacteraeota bacterium]
MSAALLLDEQREAVDAPFLASLAITGAPGTGKTSALRARVERFTREHDGETYLHVEHPNDLVMLAEHVLQVAGNPVSIIDDVEAEWVFARCAQPLFQLEWDELIAGTIDPEVPGLRSPERFLVSAFRLIRKLRDAAISPKEFLERSLQGATSFYASPPNFAHPDLIYATKDAYRDSLDVTPAELQRQYRREIDLAKVLARLYDTYVAEIRTSRMMTRRDAIAEAVDALASDPSVGLRVRSFASAAFVDEAQESTLGAQLLLEAVYGSELRRVTLAGDPSSATSTFSGARPDRAFKVAGTNVTLQQQHRNAVAVELASRQLTRGHAKIDAKNVETAVLLHRAKSEADEAKYVADAVRARLASGTPPHEIAVIFRSVSDVHEYEEALLDRNVPVAISGDLNIFADRRALDALAVLWNVWDPFRHDWLMRTLRGPVCALSDASVATLCAEPPDAQTALFTFDDEPAPTTRSGRWDPKRDLRLGWNVTRGDQDDALNPTARARVRAFRTARAGWLRALTEMPFTAFVRTVWRDGLAVDGAPGSARALAQQLLLSRLLHRLNAYANAHPEATLGDILTYAQARSESLLESCECDGDGRYVQMLNIDAARGRSFDYVVVPDARAGSFPRWYVPDSFLFSPKLGMIPKENVGDARAARTAKFSYYVFKAKAREAYNDEERRAFVYALRRARSAVLVSASGKATRGTTAPEFLEELRNARLPGTDHGDNR